VGERAAADLGRGEPVALEQHLARLVDVADLRVAAGDVQVVVRPPLGQQRVEAHRVDQLVGLHGGAAVAQLDRRGAAVQLHVGRAEAGPVVVVVAAELERGLLGAAQQVAHGRAVADPGRRHRPVEQQHPVHRQPVPAAGSRLGREPVGDVDVDLERGPHPAEREQRAADPVAGQPGQQLVAGPLGHRDRAVGGEPGQLVLADLAQRRRRDLVHLPEQVGRGPGASGVLACALSAACASRSSLGSVRASTPYLAC
jgi:hypothetical protein